MVNDQIEVHRRLGKWINDTDLSSIHGVAHIMMLVNDVVSNEINAHLFAENVS